MVVEATPHWEEKLEQEGASKEKQSKKWETRHLQEELSDLLDSLEKKGTKKSVFLQMALLCA